MVTLYIKPACPFCRRVLAVVDRLVTEVDIKDVTDNEVFTAELLEKGGKQQVPYLVDEDKNVAMYESDDIIAYLQKEYGTASKPRVHNAGAAVCVACEG